MPGPSPVMTLRAEKSLLDRALSLCADVRAGEGTTAVLMLINIFVLLVCYSVIKTVREPLILLGGGAEVRSYAAAGQALLLMGFVPLYSWFVSRVDRAKLLVGVTLFFVVCIELFASAVAAGVPYVGIAFFIWVGIFNISLVAQFWSFANDIYSKESGARLFPIIVIGMTAGAPLGSFVSARLFRLGFHPQSILQISALLLAASVVLYLWINSRDSRQPSQAQPTMSSSGGFRLVLGSGHLRMIAALIVLLNVVNTTREYAISRLLTDHVNHLALVDPTLDRQAFIDILGEGQGDVSAVMLPPPEGIWGIPLDMLRPLPGYALGVEKSREEGRAIMRRLGYGPEKPLKVTVSARNIAAYRDPGAILIDQLKSIGIEGELETVETANWIPKLMRKDFTLAVSLSGSAVDDPDQIFYESYVCKSPRNYTSYCNPEVETLIDKQSVETDPEKRKRIVWDIERRMIEEGVRPVIYHARQATCWQPQVKNITMMVNSAYNGWRMEDVWLDR